MMQHHRFFDYKVKNNTLHFYDYKIEEYRYLCRYIKVLYVLTDIEDKSVSVVIEYFHNGEYDELTIARSDFIGGSKLMTLLADKGLDVSEFNIKYIHEYLLYSEEEAEHKLTHKIIGWHMRDNKREFFLDTIVTSNKKSVYKGILSLGTKGYYNKWLNIVEPAVESNHRLALALVLGLSAPIVSIMRELRGFPSLFINLAGKSTTGKTTASILATGSFGLPSKSDESLITTWNSTSNALIGFFKGNKGVPFVIDEASLFFGKDYSNFIYMISDSADKARMNSDGVNKLRARWATTIISTAENSMLSQTNQNNGIRVRLTELMNITWTDSAKQAEEINNVLMHNYGHAGIAFVQHISKYDDDTLLKIFEIAKKHVMKQIVKVDEFTNRIANGLAIIYMTTLLAKKALNINLNKDEILKILIEADEKQFEDRDMSGKALEAIKQFVIENSNSFYVAENVTNSFSTQKMTNNTLPNGKIIGRVEADREGYFKFYLPREYVDRILREHGFNEPEGILRDFRDKGIIKCDKNKFVVKKVLYPKSTQVRVVQFIIRDEIEVKKKPKKTVKSAISPSQKKFREDFAKLQEETINEK